MFGRTYTTHSIYDFPGSRFGTRIAPPGVRWFPLALSMPFTYTSGVYAVINNFDRTQNLIWDSLEVENILTRQVDTARFRFHKGSGDTFTVSVNDNVKIFDSQNIIFQGIVTQVKKRAKSAALIEIECEAVDFTRMLDNVVVHESFTDQTVEYIVKFLLTKYAPEFLTYGVTMRQNVESITFNYQTIAKCLEELCDMFGGDFWVDEYKVLNMRVPEEVTAPFTLTDTNGNFLQGSLEFEDDISQLRNMIYLRGGYEIGASQTYSKIADGTQKVFNVGYHFSSLPTVTDNAAAQTVGTLNVDDSASYNCMWDPANDIIQFSAAPTNGHTIAVSGTPLNPILLKYPERSSITEFGERDLTIIDKTIVTRDGARQRARAELLKYAETLVSARFTTLTTGLEAGQTLTISSDLFDVSDDFIITHVRKRMLTPRQYQYEVTLVSTKINTMVDLLAKMLRSKLKEQLYDANESFDPVEAILETISITELIETLVNGDVSAPETITTAEAVTLPGGTGINFGTIFVAGPWTPSATKRQFNIERSPLG